MIKKRKQYSSGTKDRRLPLPAADRLFSLGPKGAWAAPAVLMAIVPEHLKAPEEE